MKIHIDKKDLLKQLLWLIVTFSVIVAMAAIFFNEVFTRYYLKDPGRVLVVIAGLLTGYLVLAFWRGSIGFSAGDAKDDQPN